MPDLKEARRFSVEERLPVPLRRVIAETKDFRCLAYLDEKKDWRFDSTDEEITGVLAWQEPP